MTTKAIKDRKERIFDFLNTQGSDWKVLLSRKALTQEGNHYAEVIIDQKMIIINPYKSFIECLDSVVHEILHILHPKSYEKTILRWEKEVMANMSPSDKTLLMDLFFSKMTVIWDE